MTPAGSVTVLHTFAGGSEGASPVSSLLMGKDGRLYGTTQYGGSSNQGTVFKLTTTGTNFTTLHTFTGTNGDGAQPVAGLIAGTDGLLYGTTHNGGTNNVGAVYRINANGSYSTFYSFTGLADGFYPSAKLLQASDGNFYSGTYVGGAQGGGVLFRLTPRGVLTILYSFNGANGFKPQELVEGLDGNLYGCTAAGGGGTAQTGAGNGIYYKLQTLLPLVSRFSPASAGVGAKVAINGINLSKASSVKVNGKIAFFTIKSDAQLIATVPAGATSGPITVVTANGSFTTTTAFTVIPAPTIGNFTPAHGPVGTSVTLTGTNFMGATAVKFNGVAATFTVNSATQITATVPAGATTGKITVFTPGGTAVSANDFIVP